MIYIHRISDEVADGIAGATSPVLSRICGETAMKNMMIVTTTWGMADEEIATENEDKLRAYVFKGASDSGVQVHRHYDTEHSAQDIIREVVSRPSLGVTYSRLQAISQRPLNYPSQQLFEPLLVLCQLCMHGAQSDDLTQLASNERSLLPLPMKWHLTA